MGLTWGLPRDYYKETDKIEKINILDSFSKECNAKKMTGFLSFYGSINGQMVVTNNKIRSKCTEVEKEIKINDSTKKALLYTKTLMIYDDYSKYISYYFPENQRKTLDNIYKSENFDLKYLVTKNNTAHKYLERAVMYGLTVNDFSENNVFILNEPAYKYIVEFVMSKAYGFGGEKIWSKTFPLYVNTTKEVAKRKDIATALNELSKLDILFSSAKKQKYEILANGVYKDRWTYDSLVLKNFKIVASQSSFRPNDNATIYEFLIMLIKSLNYNTCGNANCSDGEVMGVLIK